MIMWSCSRLYIAPFELLYIQIFDRVDTVDPIDKTLGLIELFDGI